MVVTTFHRHDFAIRHHLRYFIGAWYDGTGWMIRQQFCEIKTLLFKENHSSVVLMVLVEGANDLTSCNAGVFADNEY